MHSRGGDRRCSYVQVGGVGVEIVKPNTESVRIILRRDVQCGATRELFAETSGKLPTWGLDEWPVRGLNKKNRMMTCGLFEVAVRLTTC